MKLYSWNVNGIRAVLKKNFEEFVLEHNPDVLCLQETKARAEQVELPLSLAGYRTYWNSAEKAGYSGTAIFTKDEPLAVSYGIGIEEHDTEGRVITATFARPGSNRMSPGFSDPERESFSHLLESGFTDTFRAANPGLEGAYSWWSYRAGARGKNIGWRLDYFGVSNALTSRVTSPLIHADVLGSDHCPVSIEFE